MVARPPTRLLLVIGPGLLVAATGVGAGDLATAGFAGARLGMTVAWAVLLGAFLKFVMTEALTRWQLVTGESVLDGALTRLGPIAKIVFAVYLVPWSFIVGAALISACGVTATAFLPDVDPARGKLWLGALHSLVGVVLVWSGGYRLVERVMAICVGLMFVTVVFSAMMLRPNLAELASGLVVPRIPQLHDGGLTWTVGLLGGVGGTLTVICYGYWIREEGRVAAKDIGLCRIDLAVGYAATALFGVAMLVIAAAMTDAPGASGTQLILALADSIGAATSPAVRGIFLAGAWAAVFSSLLGVWQAVPYVFADFLRLVPRSTPATARPPIDVRSLPYRAFLIGLASIPMLHVARSFEHVQKAYAVIGACFLPLLAIVLLILGRRGGPLGEHRNRWTTVLVLVGTVGLFVLAGWMKLAAR